MDAVTIDDTKIVQAPADNSEITDHKASTLTGLSVTNQDGVIIGSVDDLEFDEQNGQLTALLIHRGGLIGIGRSHEVVPASAIRVDRRFGAANIVQMVLIDMIVVVLKVLSLAEVL